MRSWNADKVDKLIDNFRVRNLPMRSWNKSFRWAFFEIGLCSQFTNEELKRGCLFRNNIYSCKFAIYQWGVETLSKNGQSYSGYTVRNLPMRSWNFYERFIFTFYFVVRNLPMRSWNLERNFGKTFGNRVRNLPMRSWNKDANFSPIPQPACSQFTNEELKLGKLWLHR